LIELAAVPSTGRATQVEPRSAAEAEAVARLYDRHSRRIFGFCLYQLRKPDEAEDAVQMTFMYALGALRRGVVPAAESAWLLKIARNVCLSRFDAARRRRNVEVPSDPLVLEETAPASFVDDADAPNLRAALERLPERQCRAIVMREWQGLSYAEIAAELDLSVAAVETLIFRARQSLARELRGEEQDAKRRAFDLWSLLGWAKSLLGSGAAKIAIGAAAVASVGAAVSVPLVQHSSPGAKRPAVASTRAAVVQAAPVSPRPAATKSVRSRALHHRHATRAKPARHVGSPGTVSAPSPQTSATATTPEPTQSAGGGPAPPPSAPSTPAAPPASAPAAAAVAPPAVAPAPPAPPTAPLDVPALPPVQVPSLPPVQLPPVQVPTVSTPSLPTPPPLQVPTVQVPPVQVPTPTLPDPPKLPKLP
jgi:RNA polymerase sigma factor (sigma-70 family)